MGRGQDLYGRETLKLFYLWRVFTFEYAKSFFPLLTVKAKFMIIIFSCTFYKVPKALFSTFNKSGAKLLFESERRELQPSASNDRLRPACRQADFTKDGSFKTNQAEVAELTWYFIHSQTVLASGFSKAFIHGLLFDSRRWRLSRPSSSEKK